MKKLLKTLFICFCVLTQTCFAEGAVVTFDPTNWISGLDRLYATYDEITNSLKQIEQNYQKMQHAIEEAKSLDWENIQWDGDFDFRDELRQAGTQVNKRLNIIRKAEDCFQKKTIKFGNQSFSYADLMTVEGWKGLGDAFVTSADNSYKSAMEAWCNKLTDKQKAHIMRKYGITPQNYYRTKAREALLKAEMTKIVGAAEQELQDEQLTENQNQINEVMKKIMQGGTQKEIAQYTALLQNLTLQRMDLLKQQQESAISQQAQIDALQAANSAEEETKKAVADSISKESRYTNEANFLDTSIKVEKEDKSNINIPKM